MPWYFYHALRQLFPSKKRVSFFSVSATTGVMLGVMVLVIVLSVMNGFGAKIRESLRGINGDIRITSGDIMYDWEQTFDKASQVKGVKAVAPMVEGMFMMKYGNRPAFPGVRGIDPFAENHVRNFDKYMIEGDLKDLDDESIILSVGLANGLGVQIGSMVEVYAPLMLERMKEDEVLLPRELVVVGVTETGWNKADMSSALVSLRLLQELFGLDQRDGIHGLTVKVAEGAVEAQVISNLKEALGDSYYVASWEDMQEDFLFVLKMEKTMMFFIILFVILVASFSIASSLMSSVVRKTREIGLLGALGARSREIVATYCLQGFFIGVMGTVLGVIGAMLAIHYRNGIVETIASWTQREDILVRFYQFAEIPVHYEFADFVVICLSSIVIATLAGVIPAIRAGRMKPAEALRSE